MERILWKPKLLDDKIHIKQFIDIINNKFHLNIREYHELYEWSVNNPENFWEETWKYSDIIYSEKYTSVVDDIKKMPGANWFPNARLNFAENLLKFRDNRIAIHFKNEAGESTKITYSQLFKNVEALAHSLKEVGISEGDRIVSYLPNIPEAIVAMLATSSIGAIWSSTSPDFGAKGVLDRFAQIEPKLIFSTLGYNYNGKFYNTSENLSIIVHNIESLETVVVVDTNDKDLKNKKIKNSISYDKFISKQPKPIKFKQLPFNYPLYILYSSGTTGPPKSIVHSGGGTLIQHLKELLFHCNLHREDNIFYYTTCGWMMWNWLVTSLAVGSSITIYDGSPFYPHAQTLWRMVDEIKISIFGTSAKYIEVCKDKNIVPKKSYRLKSLKTILSTGSPLIEECFDYVYKYIKKDVLLGSISGGTDIISCFALSSPILPVIRGELQCRGLGMDVKSFNDDQKSVINKKGELVCSTAFPSIPLYFWNDKNNNKFYETYFTKFPGSWHHGDLITINNHGGVKIFGRSDTTLNPGGVRIGTAEIYRAISSLPYLDDSIVVGQKWKNDQRIILFIKLSKNVHLDEKIKQEIQSKIKTECSHRHIPQKIIEIPSVPYTMNGKKVELAVKQIIDGDPILNLDSLKEPEVLEYYKDIPELID